MPVVPRTTPRPVRRILAELYYFWVKFVGRRTTRFTRRFVALAAVLALVLTLLFEFDDTFDEEADIGVQRIRIVRREDWRGHPMIKAGTGIVGGNQMVVVNDERGWLGWSGMSHIFAFGDSQIATGFNLNGPQPDSFNPLGNPAWPGRTFSYGPNLLGHLTATYNHSFLLTYNFAIKGAPFDKDAKSTAPFSLVEQINKQFLPRYGKSTKDLMSSNKGQGKWPRRTSLFVMHMGADMLLYEFKSRGGGRNDSKVIEHMGHYERCLEKLYSAGARNFLLVNTPELEKSPFIRTSGIKRALFDVGAEIVQYNGHLAFLAHRFAERHIETANVFLFDNHKLTLSIREGPPHHPETENIKRFEGFCFPYIADRWSGGGPSDEVYDAKCDVPLSQWLWRDDSHHTEPTQRLMARKAVEQVLMRPGMRLPVEFF